MIGEYLGSPAHCHPWLLAQSLCSLGLTWPGGPTASPALPPSWSRGHGWSMARTPVPTYLAVFGNWRDWLYFGKGRCVLPLFCNPQCWQLSCCPLIASQVPILAPSLSASDLNSLLLFSLSGWSSSPIFWVLVFSLSVWSWRTWRFLQWAPLLH